MDDVTSNIRRTLPQWLHAAALRVARDPEREPRAVVLRVPKHVHYLRERGCEEVVSPGLISGLLLRVLGAVPDAAVIIASGLAASKEEAQAQVVVGMGMRRHELWRGAR
jgi:hypothetical protein